MKVSKFKNKHQIEIIDDITFMLDTWIRANLNELGCYKYPSQQAYYKGRIGAYEKVLRYITNQKIRMQIELINKEKKK